MEQVDEQEAFEEVIERQELEHELKVAVEHCQGCVDDPVRQPLLFREEIFRVSIWYAILLISIVSRVL